MLWIALHTGNSLRRALDIPLSQEIGNDWVLHPDTLTLQRLPPQRLPGWRPKGEQLNWVNPIADRLALPIPKLLAKSIKKCLTKHSDPKLLGEPLPVEDAVCAGQLVFGQGEIASVVCAKRAKSPLQATLEA